MKIKLKPIILAAILAALIHGITYLIPDFTQGEELEITEVSLDYDRYINELPFQMTSKDHAQVIALFKDIEGLYRKGEKEDIPEKLNNIEKILDGYWYSETLLSSLIDIEVNDDLLLSEDVKRLDDLRKRISEVTDKKTLFKNIGLYHEAYYTSLNHLYSIYKDEIENDALMTLELVDGKVLKLNHTPITKPTYEYETFLFSRLFTMSEQDYTEMYDMFMNAKDTGDHASIKKMHEKMNHYWLETQVKDMLIPIDTYRSHLFDLLTEEEKESLEQKYQSFIELTDVKALLNACIEFNEAIGIMQKNLYTNYYEPFDLNLFLESEDEHEF